jgi:hypothetical protein
MPAQVKGQVAQLIHQMSTCQHMSRFQQHIASPALPLHSFFSPKVKGLVALLIHQRTTYASTVLNPWSLLAVPLRILIFLSLKLKGQSLTLFIRVPNASTCLDSGAILSLKLKG